MGETYNLNSLQELSGSGRLGALRRGPYTGTFALWKGRPPAQSADGNPKVLCIAVKADDPSVIGATSRTVSIKAECGNGDGGVITRHFIVGEGVSVDIRVGSFRHVKVVTTSPIPDGSTLYFSWAEDLPFSSNGFTLLNFLNYPVPNTRVALFEGSSSICPEQACTLTWTLVSLGTTFVQAAAAGFFTPIKWGTLQANVATKFIIKLRGF